MSRVVFTASKWPTWAKRLALPRARHLFNAGNRADCRNVAPEGARLGREGPSG